MRIVVVHVMKCDLLLKDQLLYRMYSMILYAFSLFIPSIILHGFEGRIWVLIVQFPDDWLVFTFFVAFHKTILSEMMDSVHLVNDVE